MNRGRRGIASRGAWRPACVGALLLSCGHAPASTSQDPRPSGSSLAREAAAPRPAVALDLAAILAGLSSCHVGASEVIFETFDVAERAFDLCEEQRFPRRLPAVTAARAGALVPGAALTLVHAGGADQIVVHALGCDAADEDFEPHRVVVEVASPIAKEAFGRPSARPTDVPQNLAVLGAVHPGARLRAPEAIDRSSSEGRAALRAMESSISELEAARTTCGEDRNAVALPAAAVSGRAAQLAASAPAFWIEAKPHRLAFAIVEDPCSYDAFQIGMVVDPKAGRPMPLSSDAADVDANLSSNAGIDLLALVDLDGDGTEELLVEVSWAEDGGGDLLLLAFVDGAWQRRTLWSRITP